MGPLGRVVDVWHLGECHHLTAGLHVVAIEHDAVAIGVVVVVEHGIDGAVVFLAFHHLLMAVCEHIATLVSVVAAEFGRLETYGYAKLGGLHGILQCLTGVELSDEEVACSDRHLGRCAKLVGIAGGELHAGTVVALLHRHRWILVWLGRASAHKEAKLALDVGKIFFSERSVIAYSALGIGRLIYQLPIPLCKMFIREIFEGKSPDDFDEETLTTINKFFENNLNVSETSRQLYIHRNTLVYRLDKLQKSTGLDLRVFEDAITFKIALMVVKYMKYMESLEY